jgi:DNA-binding response OmpR family regulator
VISPQSIDDPLSSGTGRILLVEDEEIVREGLTILLEMVGYEVIAVTRGEEAMALPLIPAPDLLLSDVSLPGIGGSALAEILRARWPSLRITLMSGHIDAQTLAASHEGGWDVLQKPFGMDELCAHLSEALRKPPRA